MRRERSLDLESGRKNCTLVNSGERPLKSSPAHIQVIQYRRLIKECVCNFQSFVILYIHVTVTEDSNWRNKTPAAHNFFWNVPVFTQLQVAYFSWHLQNEGNNELKKKNPYTEQTATQPARILIYFSFLNYLAKRTEVFISEDQMKLGTCLIKTSFWRVYNFNPDFLTFSVMEILFTFSKHQSTAVPVGLQARSLHSLCFIILN